MNILYEDKDVLAINKPTGLMVHGDGRSKEQTLADLILKEYPKLKNVGEPQTVGRLKITDESEEETDSLKSKILNLKSILRPGIVHRLDRETSGVILIAKNQK